MTDQDYNLTDIDDEPSYADIADEDGNKFEQEIQRDQPHRAARRYISRMNALLNEGENINEPYTPGEMIERAIEKSLHERRTMRVTHHLPKQKKDTLESMAVYFCMYFKIPAQLLFIKSNKAEIVEYRRLFIAYTNPKFGPTRVGKFLGYKDHSTVSHHQDTHDDMMEQDNEYRFKFLKFSVNS